MGEWHWMAGPTNPTTGSTHVVDGAGCSREMAMTEKEQLVREMATSLSRTGYARLGIGGTRHAIGVDLAASPRSDWTARVVLAGDGDE